MNRTHILPALLALLVLLGTSDSSAQNEAQYRYADATQLWRLTDNAAALSLDSGYNRGVAYFDLQHREGDYRRTQEGGQKNQLEFATERYQRINQLLVGYGSFRFDMDRTKDRSWCDVMRPYNADPFFSGSSINGKYDTQQFDPPSCGDLPAACAWTTRWATSADCATPVHALNCWTTS